MPNGFSISIVWELTSKELKLHPHKHKNEFMPNWGSPVWSNALPNNWKSMESKYWNALGVSPAKYVFLSFEHTASEEI